MQDRWRRIFGTQRREGNGLKISLDATWSYRDYGCGNETNRMTGAFISGSTLAVSAASCRRGVGYLSRGGKMPPLRFADFLDALCREFGTGKFDDSHFRPIKHVLLQAIPLTALFGTEPPG